MLRKVPTVLSSLLLSFPMFLACGDSEKRDPRESKGELEAPILDPDSRSLSQVAEANGFLSLGLDPQIYSQDLLTLASLYNGGRDGQSGSRAFSPTFDGYFSVHLDRSWQTKEGEATTAVAQSRWIYMNATVHQHQQSSRPDIAARYLGIAQKGMRTLLQKFQDPVHGGFFHQVKADGSVVQSDKVDFSNCQPLLAFAALYQSKPDPSLMQESQRQLQVLFSRFADPKVKGGVIPGWNRDYTRWSAGRYRNNECITHIFEGLLALYEVAPPDAKESLGQEIKNLGRFLTEQALRPMEASSDYRYFPFFFDENWKPSAVPLHLNNLYAGSAWVSVGHNFEMAFLLSRAVELGFDPAWLEVAKGLLRFGIDFGMDTQRGGVEFLVDYTGRPIGADRNPMFQRLDWWPQCEAARALLHFAIVRGDREALSLFKKQDRFMRQVFLDKEEGGWFAQVANRGDAMYPPLRWQKGDLWQDAYHQTMYYAEALRLAQFYP